MTNEEILERASDYVGIGYLNGVEYSYINPCLLKAIDAGIIALREQAERDKGCEFCTTEEQQNERGRVFYKEFPHDARFLTTLDDAHLQIAFDEKSDWVLHFEDDSGDRMFDVKIASCPMCGRRLEAQHE